MSSIMEQTMDDFLGRKSQFLGGIAEVVQGWARGAPAKVTARRWGVDPKTAENVSQGVVSSRTLEKVVAAEGWPLVLALGESLTGQSYEEWLEHELQKARAGTARLEALAERSRVARGQDPRPPVAGPHRSFLPVDRRGGESDRGVGLRDP